MKDHKNEIAQLKKDTEAKALAAEKLRIAQLEKKLADAKAKLKE